MNRFPRDDAGRLHLHALALGVFDRAFAVDRIAETVDHAAEQALADGNIDDRAGTADGVAFLDGGVRAEDHDTDIRSEEHTSELQSLMRISYAVFCLQKK